MCERPERLQVPGCAPPATLDQRALHIVRKGTNNNWNEGRTELVRRWSGITTEFPKADYILTSYVKHLLALIIYNYR